MLVDADPGGRRVDPDEITGAVPHAANAKCTGNSCGEYVAITCQRYPAGKLYKLEPAFAVISDYVDAVWRAGGMPMPVFPVPGWGKRG